MSDNTFAIVLRDRSERGIRRPKSSLSRRSGGAATLALDHEVIANVDAISAPELIYPEAVYLHNGESYFVRELDLEGKVAYVERHEMDYYTQAVLDSSVTIGCQRAARAALADVLLAFGGVDVTWQTVAFKKIKFRTRENIGQGPVDIPAQTLPTTAFWLSPGDGLREQMQQAGLRTSEGLVGLRNLCCRGTAHGGDVRQPRPGGRRRQQEFGAQRDDRLRSLPGRTGLQRKGLPAHRRAAGDRLADDWRVRLRRAAPVAWACRTCGRRSTAIRT